MRKTIRGIPLALVVVLGLLSVGVLGATFSAWVLQNQLVQPTPPTTYTGETKTFVISTAPDNLAIITITLTGSATPSSVIHCITKLEVLSPSWQIAIHSITTVLIKNSGGATVATFTYDCLDKIGKGGVPFVQFDDTFTPTEVGTYSITPSVANMVWSQPP
jgi:hypothetical protein